jgi:AhpC/TSA family
MVPHLNELQEEFGARGLSVIGVTGEGESETSAWIEKHGAKYAYAYASNIDGVLKTIRAGGYPHSALVDASGVVVWTGHPAELSDEMIEQHLVGVINTPLYEWPKAANKVAKLVRANNLPGALREAKAYVSAKGEKSAEILAEVEAALTSTLTHLQARFDLGDYYTVQERGPALLAALEASEATTALTKNLAHIAESPEAQHALAGQEAWRRLVGKGELRKVKDCEKRIEDLTKLEKKYEGTFAAQEIQAQISIARTIKKELLDR